MSEYIEEVEVEVDGEKIVVHAVDYKKAIRQMNDDEKALFSQAATSAVSVVPAFRDGVALMRPYFDATAETAYTDKYSRVGLGSWFFSLNPKQRSAVLLHECMHVLNNHFQRSDGQGISPEIMNIAGDFEINCSLVKLPSIDIGFGIMPDNEPFDFPRNLTMEQYAHALKQEQNKEKEKNKNSSDQNDSENSEDDNSGNSSGDSSQHGQGPGNEHGRPKDGEMQDPSNPGDYKSRSGSPCGTSNDARSEAADEAGIERASDAEQSVAKKNTAARIVDELNKAKQAGNGHMEDFLQISLKNIKPPKVDWRNVFRRVLSTSQDNVTRGRQDYSYARVNRRMSGSKYIFPGMVQYVPTAMFGIDTSGSMSQSDYSATLPEVESIIKSVSKSRQPLRVFSVDTEISNVKTVNSVNKLDFKGGGGTEMSKAFVYVNSLSKKEKPDVFVLATDAGLFAEDWKNIENTYP